MKNKGEFIGYYLESNSELVPLWQEFFKSRGIILKHNSKCKGVFEENIADIFDFYLLDDELLFSTDKDIAVSNGFKKPIFILADYIDSNLLRNCLELGVKDCFDRSKPLKDICSTIIDTLNDIGSSAYVDKSKGDGNVWWLTWNDVKSKLGVSHISELTRLKKHKLMEEVFIHEFFIAEGNISLLAESISKITRVTAKKYYNQFQREIFIFLISYFPDKEEIPYIPLERECFVRAMKKQWFYEDYKAFIAIYNKDINILEMVLKIPAQRIKLFSQYWDDIVL